MAGILDFLFNRQKPGMLGGGMGGYDPMLAGDPRFGGGATMAAQPPGQGKFGSFLQNNPMTLLQLGSAIGSAPGWGAALGQIGQTVPQGMALDKSNREKQRQRAAVTALLKSRKTGEALPPEALEVFDAYPELGAKFALDNLIPEPKEYGFEEVAGTLVRTDKSAGTAEPVYGAPDVDAPDIVTLYDEQTGMEYKAQWNPAKREYERVGGLKAPSGTSLSVGPDGEVQFTQGNVKPLTEAQSKDTVFVTRAAGALPIIDQYGDALTSLTQSVGGSAPIIGNYMKSTEFQQAEQAGKEFLQAILRKDTGAAITKEETDEYGSVYLPRPGDDPTTLEQKKQSRRRALSAIQAGLPPQAILALEKAGVDLSAGAAAPQAPTGPTVIDGITIERVP